MDRRIEKIKYYLKRMGYELTHYGNETALAELFSDYNEAETASHIALATMALDIKETELSVSKLMSFVPQVGVVLKILKYFKIKGMMRPALFKKDSNAFGQICTINEHQEGWINKVLGDPISGKERLANKTAEDISGNQKEWDKEIENIMKGAYQDFVLSNNLRDSAPKNGKPSNKELDKPEGYKISFDSDNATIGQTKGNEQEGDKKYKKPENKTVSYLPLSVFIFISLAIPFLILYGFPKDKDIHQVKGDVNPPSPIEKGLSNPPKEYFYKICKKEDHIVNKNINFEKIFTGSIENKQGLTMHLSRSGMKLSGHFIDISTLKEKKLSGYIQGTLDEETICLNESLDGKATGIFIGKILRRDKFEGMWIANDNSEKYRFRLKKASK